MADTDDKIAKAVEYLAQIPGSVYTPNTLPMGLALASAAELAAVFVASATYRKAFRAYANEVTVDDGTFELKRCEELREACNAAEDALDAALRRAAEKVLA